MWEKQKFKAKGINYFRVHIIRWWGWYNPECVMLLGCYWKCPICNVVVGSQFNVIFYVPNDQIYHNYIGLCFPWRCIRITLRMVNTLYTKSPFQVFYSFPRPPVNSVLFSCLIVLHSMSSGSSFSLCHISESHIFIYFYPTIFVSRRYAMLTFQFYIDRRLKMNKIRLQC